MPVNVRRWVTASILATCLGAAGACQPVGPTVPTGSPTTGTGPVGTASPGGSSPGSGAEPTPAEGVDERAMLGESELPPGDYRLLRSVTGGPSGPDGNPQGWRGDAQWIFHRPYCDAYAGLGIRGFFNRRAIRVNSYRGPGDADARIVVERYADAAAGVDVMREIRAVLAACGAHPQRAAGLRDVGPDALTFTAQSDPPAPDDTDWTIVRRGEYIAMLESPHDRPVGEVSQRLADRLCGVTDAC